MSNNFMRSNDKPLLLRLCNIAIKAGIIIMQHYSKEIKFEKKADNSPVTQADLEANSLIIDELKKIDRLIPILSEEKVISWNERKKWKKYWLVDPLDGTKEFINKNGEFTVNIALIDNNLPLLGIIYAPVKSLLYFAKKNKGSYKLLSTNQLTNLDNATTIKTTKNIEENNIRIIGSKSHSNKLFNFWINKKFSNHTLSTKGSSLKFCEIAEGKADIYPRFGPTSEWDIAAGHIVLEEAGGSIKDVKGNKILYNTKDSLINPDFIASANEFIKY